MNDEKLRFVSGETTQIEEVVEVVDVTDEGTNGCLANLFASEVHVIGEYVWPGRILVYGETLESAQSLRDRVLWALAQPTVPAQWQYKQVSLYDSELFTWLNLDNGGEAARLKGEGYEIRALYAKKPLEAS